MALGRRIKTPFPNDQDKRSLARKWERWTLGKGCSGCPYASISFSVIHLAVQFRQLSSIYLIDSWRPLLPGLGNPLLAQVLRRISSWSYYHDRVNMTVKVLVFSSLYHIMTAWNSTDLSPDYTVLANFELFQRIPSLRFFLPLNTDLTLLVISPPHLMLISFAFLNCLHKKEAVAQNSVLVEFLGLFSWFLGSPYFFSIKWVS